MTNPKTTLTVTNLESYRRYCAGQKTFEDLIHGILCRFEPNQKMRAGTELHRLIETGNIPPQFTTECGLTVILPEGDFSVYGGNPEVTNEWITSQGYAVRGRADAVAFDTVYDHKLTAKGGYQDSLQWRLYLLMFNARRFIYNVFFCGDIKDNTLVVKEFYTEEYTAYSGMVSECEDAVRDYMTYIQPIIDEAKRGVK